MPSLDYCSPSSEPERPSTRRIILSAMVAAVALPLVGFVGLIGYVTATDDRLPSKRFLGLFLVVTTVWVVYRMIRGYIHDLKPRRRA